MIVRKTDGRHEQTVPAREWAIPVPAGRTNIELFGVYTPDGRSQVHYDSYDLSGGVITIYFGIDAVTGVARYEYDAEQDDVTTVTGNGGVIHVTQYNYPR